MYLHFFHLKKGYIIFISKDKGEIEEVAIEYDEARAKQVIKEIDDFYINHVDKNILPEKCSGGFFGCDVCFPKDDKNEKAQNTVPDL
jgi:CRISPR/Cas system-associated exonuclease Cas4 (RecB family)